ncbi:MAG: putative DNA binding domain-containing protein [Gemmatimonadetes bacterium]|nr:putative DNA binding domain-containing protein [Gemmatimonadota bacterium]
MNGQRSPEYLEGLLRELCALPYETEWVEFKEDNTDPQEIGEYLSALANSAALAGKAAAYLMWGVRDHDHAVVGTNFDPRSAKKGNEELENWLLRLLEPKIDFHFFSLSTEKGSVILTEINRASRHPVRFAGQEYIRVGSYKKKLRDHPEKERALWRIFDRVSFEEGIAAERLKDEDVLLKLDYPKYFDLLNVPLPDGHVAILDALQRDRLIALSEAGGFNITNLGAILFAKNLGDFPRLKRKAIRVIQYVGTGRIETLREYEYTKGYAAGFDELIGYIDAQLPANEVIGQARRKTVRAFPELAVRELVANMLIHQDFFATGAGPMVEIFEGRIEITNPGEPLVDTQRFLDSPPTSRNEVIASLMRRFRICEERGSGIDKVAIEVERYQLPAPIFEVPPNFTRVVLFAHKALSDMDKADRVRACYLHACLQYVNRDFLTNASLRVRFGVKENYRSVVSRYIREAVDASKLKAFDEQAARKMKKYLPFWA